MSCLEMYLSKPVLLQLKEPVAGVISSSEVDLGAGSKCGSAIPAIMQDPATRKQSPVLLSFVTGSIESVDPTHLVVATMGADGETPVRMCIPVENVSCVSFCVRHLDLREAPRIVTSGS